jgi:hypothetical protein
MLALALCEKQRHGREKGGAKRFTSFDLYAMLLVCVT